MRNLVSLASAIISTNKSIYVAAAALLGLFIVTTSLLTTSPFMLQLVISRGGLWHAFIHNFENVLASPLIFTYVPIAAASVEFLCSMKKGSLIAVLVPINRMDIVKAYYFLTLVAGIAASLVSTYINLVYAYLLSCLKVGCYYPLAVLGTYLIALIPTLIFVTSLSMVIYSLTPIKSGLPWILTVTYLIGVYAPAIAVYSFTGSKLAYEVIWSIFSPGYGMLRFMSQFLSGAVGWAAVTCLIASEASVLITSILAIALFNTYAEVMI